MSTIVLKARLLPISRRICSVLTALCFFPREQILRRREKTKKRKLPAAIASTQLAPSPLLVSRFHAS
jgi:hypothetical protein